MNPALLACMLAAAQFYHLPPRVLPSIQTVEGGQAGTVSRNTNGSEDLGLMQVNTVWLPWLARASRLPEQEVRHRLIGDGCFNIAAGAAILRNYLNAEHGNLMRAIGDYHSHTPARNEAYQARVLETAARLFAARPNPASH